MLGHSFNFLMAQGTDPKALTHVEAAFDDLTRRWQDTARDMAEHMLIDAAERNGLRRQTA